VRPVLHGSLFDSWMLANFPGRTLEELDSIDILRFMRAMDARALEATERLEADILSTKIKSTDVPGEEYDKILANDVLWQDYKLESIAAQQRGLNKWQM
jgi:hypothetical protein